MVNKAILLGRLGKDAEQSFTQHGTEVCNFSLATSRKIKDKNTGEYNEVTQWHRLKCFNHLAEFANKHLKKGSQVYVEGEIQYSEYEKDGIKRYSTDILANKIEFAGAKPE